MIILESVGATVARGSLFESVDASIHQKDKIGIVGRNGCGKSTLLKILSGDLLPDSGKVTFEKDKKILLVKQELPEDEKTPLDFLKDTDLDLVNLYDSLGEVSAEMISSIQTQIDTLENERYEVLARQVLLGLGLTVDQQNSPMRDLSGGLRMRIALASGLVQNPDVLLLDEPTNHLDLPSVAWLFEYLKNFEGACVIVSHDVSLLNEITKKTWRIKGGRLEIYNASYENYLTLAQDKLFHEQKMNAKLEKDIKENEEYIAKFKSKPSRRGNCTAREKVNLKLEERIVEIIPEEPIIPIEFPEPAILKDPIVKIEKATIGYEKNIVLSDISFDILTTSRIGLLGYNGQGKSTLARFIADRKEVKLYDGDILRTQKLRVGYFSQDQTDELDISMTVYEQLQSNCSSWTDAELREHLAHFGFGRDKVKTMVQDLSGGEKSRLSFAIIAAERPNLIVMDEPTNHLDIETRSRLIDVINSYPGSIVLVSHDWDLLEKTVKNEYFIISHGSISRYKGSLSDYKIAAQSGSLLQNSGKTIVKNTDSTASFFKNKSNTSNKKTKKDSSKAKKKEKPLSIK